MTEWRTYAEQTYLPTLPRQKRCTANTGKTKSTEINTLLKNSFPIYGDPIYNVSRFPYIGSQITPDGGAKDDIVARTKKAKAAFASLKKMWFCKQLAARTMNFQFKC